MSDASAPRERGTLVVLSAPSGTGKTTLVRALVKALPTLVVSVSATTRTPRSGERDGIDYHFLSRDEFLARVARSSFLEHAEVHGNLYGTLREPVERDLASGRDVLLEIDVQGARQVRVSHPETRSVFIMPPSRDELDARLRRRGLDADEVIARRLRDAAIEVGHVGEYDHVVVNASLVDSLEQLLAVVRSYRQTPHAMRARIDAIRATFGSP